VLDLAAEAEVVYEVLTPESGVTANYLAYQCIRP
jgi:hypothetical protein